MYRDDSEPVDSTEAFLARAISSIGMADFVPTTLDYLRCAAPFRGCFLTILNGTKRPEHVYDNVRAERRSVVIDRWLDGAYLLDPFYTVVRDLEGDAVLCLRETAPDRFPQSTYFMEYYRAIRLRDEVAVLIGLPDGSTLFYSIGRTGDDPRFSARDIAALRRVLPVAAALNRRHFADRMPSHAASAGDDAAQGTGVAAAFAHFGQAVLTEREREIAGLILKGHSSQSIARNVDIKPGTVKIHRKNIYRKLGISSQNELFAMFLSTVGTDRA